MRAVEPVPDLKSLKLFDGCVTLGWVVHSKCPEHFETVSYLIETMDRFHVKEALVHEHHARLSFPREDGTGASLTP